MRALRTIFVLLGLLGWVYHAGTAVPRIRSAPGGRDFASYYIAAQVVREGGDPYDRTALRRTAQQHGRRGVHPYFYPPPFLLAVLWTTAWPLPAAYRMWATLDLLCAAGAAAVLARWWRALHPATPAVVVLLFGLSTVVPNNHVMGQANHPVLLGVLLGLWAMDRGRPWLGGALVGLGCMAKMSPALFVGWALLHRRGRAVLGALGAALAASVAVLPWVPIDTQWRFYTAVLPQFASGIYHGLSIPIGLFGNHSIPNLLHQLFPGSGPGLSSPAAVAARLVDGALLAGAAWVFRVPPRDPWSTAGQVGAMGVVMLLVPVYTYEHHLVWAFPAMVVCATAILARRGPAIPRGTALLAIAVLLADLQLVKRWSLNLGGAAGWLLQESKFFALLVVGALAAWLGAHGRSPRDAEAPEKR